MIVYVLVPRRSYFTEDGLMRLTLEYMKWICFYTEKTFVRRVELKESVRDATSFLWLKDPSYSVEADDNLETYKICRVTILYYLSLKRNFCLPVAR